MTSQQENKQRAIDLLESRYRGMENVCEGIDMRLRMYFEDLLKDGFHLKEWESS